MSLKLHSVANGKTPATERVWIQVTESVNLKGYAVVDRTFAATGQLSNEFRHIFIFPDKQVSKGEWVCLTTGTGTYGRKKFSDSDTYYHEFYWGSSGCIWNNNGGDTASLIKYSLVNSVDVPAAE